MKHALYPALTALLLCAAALGAEPLPKLEKGTVHFKPKDDQAKVPKLYQLPPHSFDYELQWQRAGDVSNIDIYELRFPSPITSPTPQNNTVYAEYYRPRVQGRVPCVIVLDITGGDQSLSRGFATHLAQNKIGGLFVQMAYYGPRRPKGSKLRLMSLDIELTRDAVQQTVLDLRRAAAWMESREEIDPAKLGIMGTSLGSFMAALTGEMEPRLGRVVVLLGGGGFVEGYWNHPKARLPRLVFELTGGTKEQVNKLIAPLDPITCAENLKERKLLIMAGKRDEIVPPSMATALWKASGEQRIVWFDAGHYSAALYLVPALKEIVAHFQ